MIEKEWREQCLDQRVIACIHISRAFCRYMEESAVIQKSDHACPRQAIAKSTMASQKGEKGKVERAVVMPTSKQYKLCVFEKTVTPLPPKQRIPAHSSLSRGQPISFCSYSLQRTLVGSLRDIVFPRPTPPPQQRCWTPMSQRGTKLGPAGWLARSDHGFSAPGAYSCSGPRACPCE